MRFIYFTALLFSAMLYTPTQQSALLDDAQKEFDTLNATLARNKVPSLFRTHIENTIALVSAKQELNNTILSRTKKMIEDIQKERAAQAVEAHKFIPKEQRSPFARLIDDEQLASEQIFLDSYISEGLSVLERKLLHAETSFMETRERLEGCLPKIADKKHLAGWIKKYMQTTEDLMKAMDESHASEMEKYKLSDTQTFSLDDIERVALEDIKMGKSFVQAKQIGQNLAAVLHEQYTPGKASCEPPLRTIFTP